ncbi:MAG: hypothetical protein LIP12_17975 [Clostridiales bacterium]|nr:hypothetical protein [Clostridiales bacterium]
MAVTNTKENGLEPLIVRWLVEQNGYEEGVNSDYNREYAVDETRLLRFLQDTQPKEMDKLGVFQSDTKKRQFMNRLSGEIARRGVIDVLRKGVKVYLADLIMFYLTPTENNQQVRILYEKNIFSVTRQLRYSQDAGKLALDFHLTYNPAGLPSSYVMPGADGRRKTFLYDFQQKESSMIADKIDPYGTKK